MQTLAEMPFVAGHPALDFINTAEERGHPEAEDALTSPADLRYWGQRYGLITASAPRHKDGQAEFERAREARELLYVAFSARVHLRPFPPGTLARLAELAATAYREARLRSRPDGTISWTWSRSDLATIRHVAVTSGIELLHTQPTQRLKQCPGEHCGWFFLDTTKRGNRRWCSMSECGQDEKNRKRRNTTRRAR